MQTSPALFPSVGSTVTSIWRQEGLAAFWKGAVPTAMGMAAENAMAFGVNEALKRAFADDEDERRQNEGSPPGMVKPFAMGAITGCCSALVLLPSEVVKAKLQVVVGESVSSGQIWKQMLAKQGYRSLFVGLDSQLARDAAFYAVFFGGYEMSCYLFRAHVPSMPDELNFFISGGLAGMLGWTVAMPLDVPKTNVRARLVESSRSRFRIDAWVILFRLTTYLDIFPNKCWALSLYRCRCSRGTIPELWEVTSPNL
jgi:Mitochondrial carrier protein